MSLLTRHSSVRSALRPHCGLIHLLAVQIPPRLLIFFAKTKGVVSLKRGNSFLVQKKHSDYENPNACGRMYQWLAGPLCWLQIGYKNSKDAMENEK